MNKTAKFTLSIASVAILSLLVACGSNAQQASQSAQSSQATSQQASDQTASSTTAESSQAQGATTPAQSQAPSPQPTDIDGTYKGQDEGDAITLVVTGTTGTWTDVERDGDQEIKQVRFDAANQQVIIGDDVKLYTVNGNQLTIDDMDRDPSDRIVLTK